MITQPPDTDNTEVGIGIDSTKIDLIENRIESIRID